MENKLGKTFLGKIVEVTSFGFFVELRDIYVSGLVHIATLPDDYYHYDGTAYVLRGKRSNKKFQLGDTVKVLVAKVDVEQRLIDFVLIEDGGESH